MGMFDGSFEVRPTEGTHLGVCFAIFDIGTHETEYNGKTRKRHQMVFCFELPKERIEMEDGKDVPVVLSKFYTCSIDPRATFRQHLDSWIGRSLSKEEESTFDHEYLKELLGKPAMLSVQHKQRSNGRTSADISNIMQVPEGVEVPALEQPIQSFFFEDEPIAIPRFCKTTEWVEKWIKDSEEWGAVGATAPQVAEGFAGDPPDDLPF